MPLFILFGPTGAGKTYIGKLLQQDLGYYFYDGDADLTQEMKQALNSMRIITDRMRQRFITRLVNTTIRLAKKSKICPAITAFGAFLINCCFFGKTIIISLSSLSKPTSFREMSL